jgi:hypothetical protein
LARPAVARSVSLSHHDSVAVLLTRMWPAMTKRPIGE